MRGSSHFFVTRLPLAVEYFAQGEGVVFLLLACGAGAKAVLPFLRLGVIVNRVFIDTYGELGGCGGMEDANGRCFWGGVGYRGQ